MHSKSFTSFLYFLFSLSSLGAQTVEGLITDAATGKAIPYVSIGLIKSNRGTSAGSNGRFSIHIDRTASDTFLFSCVGYEARKIAVTMDTIIKVKLTRSSASLEPVVVRQYLRTLKLPWNGGREDHTRVSSGFETQFGKLLEAPKSFGRLDEVTVATGHRGLFSENKDFRFRIRIYSYDSISAKPGRELTDSVIEVKAKGIVRVNLRPYEIVLQERKFIVAVQWLYIEENQEVWDNHQVVFGPGIRTVKGPQTGMSAWSQFHNGQWRSNGDDPGITATVSY